MTTSTTRRRDPDATPDRVRECAGERLVLHPEGALEWPRKHTLFVADLHFGKDDHFRRAGIALPDGTLAADLARLDQLIERTHARRLVMLGDVVHAAPTPDAPWPEQVACWRARHADLAWLMIAGNHDRHFTPPVNWRLELRPNSLHEPPFVFAHEPTTDPRGYVLAGHWHPVVRLRAGGDALRLKVFAFGDAYAVLPAFGGLTGGAAIAPDDYACHALAGDQVIALPPSKD